jgi:hypothetical protein
MIVSHEHKFIFLRVSKAAGSTVEFFLRQYCKPGDIVTPLSQAEEQEMRAKGLCGPMGYREIRGDIPLLDRVKIKLGDSKALERYCVVGHSPAVRVEQYLGKAVWDSYFKFCIVRHPVDRVLSQYFWKAHCKDWHDAYNDFPRQFGFFIESKVAQGLVRKGTGIYLKNGRLAVDYVGKFEDLTNSIKHAISLAGIKTKPFELPRFKSGFRPKEEFASRLLPYHKRVIKEMFQFEFDNFGYSLE